MASGSDGEDPNHTSTGITKRQRFTTTSTGILTSSPSLQAQPQLPTLSLDLISEILCRLPVKLLLQLRCLSKSFKSLISDPEFAKKHLRLSTKRHHLMVITRNTRFELVLFDSPIPSDISTFTLVNTQVSYPNCLKTGYFDSCFCDGVLCVTMLNSSAFLWNPSLRTVKRLPPLDNKSPQSSYSFGFDKFINNYKVVAMSLFVDECEASARSSYTERCEISVLTLGMDSWRRIQDFPYSGLRCGLGIFLGGTVNWSPVDRVSDLPVIVSLDLEKESYQTIPQPDLENDHWTLGALKDCLCIYALSGNNMFLDVWIMKEYGNKASWTKLYCVPHMRKWGICDYTRTLYISENDQLLMGFDAFGNFKLKLAVYDSKNGTFMIPEIQQNLDRRMATKVYIESLVSPCF